MEEVSEISLARHPSDLVPAALVLLILTIFLTIGVASIPWLDYSESSTTYYLGGFCDYNGCLVTLTEKSPFALSSR